MWLCKTEDYGYLCTDTVAGVLVQAETTLLCFIKLKLFNYCRLLCNNYQNTVTGNLVGIYLVFLFGPSIVFSCTFCHLPLF